MADSLGVEEVRWALAEDAAQEDVTTRLLGTAAERLVLAEIVAEGLLVVAGLPLVALVFRQLDPNAEVSSLIADGACAQPGATIATVRTSARALLAGERVALNFLQHLSGIATLTRRAVDAVAGTSAQITHTRKTTPCLRMLEYYAVRVGGGVTNRTSLADAILWKDNHWAIASQHGKTLEAALVAAPVGVPVVVEIESDAQLEIALAAGVCHILADNQPPQRIAAWIRRAGPAVTFQASGAITADTARAYARQGRSSLQSERSRTRPRPQPFASMCVLQLDRVVALAQPVPGFRWTRCRANIEKLAASRISLVDLARTH